ncbi:hypothetical protein GCM10023093_25330 [Nemorincola caseinilytica]|uniref:Uncharacterized protein n=1 Tax=Nemorincola caseinilytica TaxID=2054315 RepID=A0ABP8NL71_9BACT
MRILLTLLLFAAIASLCSCEKLGICVDRDLNIERHADTTARLRLDGYYYSPADTDENGQVMNELMVFYKNGVVLLPGNVSQGNEELYLRAIGGYTGIRSSKASWGAYSIDSILNIAHWKPAKCGAQAVWRKGEVLNDTTFMVREVQIKGRYGTGKLTKEQVFRYRPHMPKPDSLNDFVN